MPLALQAFSFLILPNQGFININIGKIPDINIISRYFFKYRKYRKFSIFLRYLDNMLIKWKISENIEKYLSIHDIFDMKKIISRYFLREFRYRYFRYIGIYNIFDIFVLSIYRCQTLGFQFILDNLINKQTNKQTNKQSKKQKNKKTKTHRV